MSYNNWFGVDSSYKEGVTASIYIFLGWRSPTRPRVRVVISEPLLFLYEYTTWGMDLVQFGPISAVVLSACNSRSFLGVGREHPPRKGPGLEAGWKLVVREMSRRSSC